MMKMRKKTIFAIMAMLIIILLVSCSNNNVPSDTEGESISGSLTENTTDTAPPELKTDIVITKETASQYVIIRPERAGEELRSAASSLYFAFNNKGFKIDYQSDWTKDPSSISKDSKEILIGDTNRPESVQYSSVLRTHDYIIANNGTKIIIAGGSEEATVRAIKAFILKYLSGNLSSIKFPIGESEKSLSDYEIDSLTLFGKNITEYTVVRDKNANVFVKHAATVLSQNITDKTGYKINVANDGEENTGYRIFIKDHTAFSSKLGEKEFSYTQDGNDLTIYGTTHSVIYAVRSLIGNMSDGTLEPEKEGIFEMKADEYPQESTIAGKVPVALCDQKNKQAVVIDISASDPTSEEAIIWTWTPDQKTNGSSGLGFGTSIDEAKLRYSPILGKYVVCMTSSAGYMGVVEYPSGNVIWEVNASGYGPHSIEYLPNGMVACALSGNDDYSMGCIRLYGCKNDDTPSKVYDIQKLSGAHGVLWDSELGILWALSNTEIVAYEIGGTQESPKLNLIKGFGTVIPGGGHDMSPVLGDSDKLWVTSRSIYEYDKFKNKLTDVCQGYPILSASGIKSIGKSYNGMIIRAAATNVYKAHDTDTVSVFMLNAQGSYEQTDYVFKDRAFYKARLFLPYYN